MCACVHVCVCAFVPSIFAKVFAIHRIEKPRNPENWRKLERNIGKSYFFAPVLGLFFCAYFSPIFWIGGVFYSVDGQGFCNSTLRQVLEKGPTYVYLIQINGARNFSHMWMCTFLVCFRLTEKGLVNLFLIKLVRISGFSSLFSQRSQCF